jgi:hypothetical protein
MFASMKYLCDEGTDNCNPICPVVRCEALGDMLLVSLFFHWARRVAFSKTIQSPSSFVVSYQTYQCSTVPVEFHNCNDSVTRVTGRLRVPTMRSKDILLQAKGDHLGQVHSDQMVLEMIRGGGWSCRAVAQRRPRA